MGFFKSESVPSTKLGTWRGSLYMLYRDMVQMAYRRSFKVFSKVFWSRLAVELCGFFPAIFSTRSSAFRSLLFGLYTIPLRGF